MIEYRICSDYAILVTEGDCLENGILSIGADLPDKSLVRLYCAEEGTVCESEISSGVARFEKGAVLAGFSYVPEFVKVTEEENIRISACAFRAFELDDKVYLVRKAGNIAFEFAKMWKVIGQTLEKASLAESLSREATEIVTALSKGYRTE